MFNVRKFLDQIRYSAIQKLPTKIISFNRVDIECISTHAYFNILKDMKMKKSESKDIPKQFFQIYVIEDYYIFKKVETEFRSINCSSPVPFEWTYSEWTYSKGTYYILPGMYIVTDPLSKVRFIELLDYIHNCPSMYLIYKPYSSEIFIIFDKISKINNGFFKGIIYDILTVYDNIFPVHASCVCYDQKGILFMGPSGSGKTTFAIEFMLKGAKYMSNDTTFIRPPNQIIPYNEILNVKIGTLLRYPKLYRFLKNDTLYKYSQMKSRELWQLKDSQEITLHRNDIVGEENDLEEATVKYIFLPKLSPNLCNFEIQECKSIKKVIQEFESCIFPSTSVWATTLSQGKLHPHAFKTHFISFWMSLLKSNVKVYKVITGLDDNISTMINYLMGNIG